MSPTIGQLASRAGIRLLYRGSSELVSEADLPALLAACREAGAKILAHRWLEARRRGDPARSGCDSELVNAAPEVSVSEAERFAQEVAGRNLVFDVVLGE